MDRKKLILVVPFCAFLGIMMLLFFVLPKQTFSDNEKRTLKTMPKLSIGAVIDSSFEKNFEDYLNDHFPFRDFFVSLGANYMLYTGRNGTNGVYKGKDGYLINTPVRDKDGQLERNLQAIRSFCDKINVPVKFMAVPSTGYIMQDKLPKNHDIYNDALYLERARSVLDGGNVSVIDLEESFKNSNDQLYYKTDHHWTSKGAYIAYCLYCEARGLVPPRKNEFAIEKHGGFYGTTYSKSMLWNTEPDEIEIWDYPNNISVEIIDNGESRHYEDMFFRNHLEKADKYTVFLDGNHSLTRIVNPEGAEGKLLLVKDSYAHCLAPFLIRDYSEIVMVDLRYYQDTVSDIAADCDEVMFVYGISNLVEYKDIEILE